MKRIIKNPIFTFILGAIIFGEIVGVSAYAILANNIAYTPKDTAWKKSNGEDITNVKDAIDELYNAANNNNNNKIVDLTSKTTTDEYGNCYDLKKVVALIANDNEMFIRLKADKIVNDCNVTYTVDISDLGFQSITYKKNFDLENNPNYNFLNNSNVANTNYLTFKVDTNYGYSNKTDYNYAIYYNYSK